jgi:hypothetical protein
MGVAPVEVGYFSASDFRVSPDDDPGVTVLREFLQVLDGELIAVATECGGGHGVHLNI